MTYCSAVAQVRLEHITKSFGSGDDSVNAVDDVTIDIENHDFMILLGPSGCGKSTLLRMVAGLETPTSGDIYIGDVRVNDIEPKMRDVAMVFQSYALYPHKTVQANIEFPLKVRGASKADRAMQAKTAADALGLGPYLDRKPGQLSGGQRQRVALARAIVRQPAVFCMDEPLSNLDAKLRGETRAELVDLHRRLEATILYVTHDQIEAMTMGTRVAVMNLGHLQQIDTPQQVYAKPATVFVARFIGTPPMNVMPVGLFENSEVLVGVRPEHLRLDHGRRPRGERADGRATGPRDAADLRRGGHPQSSFARTPRRRFPRSATTSTSMRPTRIAIASTHSPSRGSTHETQVARRADCGRHVAAVGGHPRCVRGLPLGPRRPARPSAMRCDGHALPRRRLGPVRRCVPQQRVPARVGQHDSTRDHDRADRSRARHRSRRAGRQADPWCRASSARCSRRRWRPALRSPAWSGSSCCNRRSDCCPTCSTASSQH